MHDKNATERLGADAAAIARAGEIVAHGGLVAVPTETVYGLAARADSDAAVAKIYLAKGRPSFNPLIVHVASLDQARKLARFPGAAEQVAQEFWPGPLTLVLPLQAGARVAPAVTAGLDTIALRMPAHAVMQRLIAQCGTPLAAPSANRSNAISPTSAAHVLATLDGRIDAVLDGGPCERGLESSILAIRHDGSWEELRPGPVDLDAIHRQYFDRPLDRKKEQARIESPGQLARHYSPGKPVRLNADHALPDEFLIGFGPVEGDCTLSAKGDLAEAAAQLYRCLHLAAASSRPGIAIARIEEIGIGKAINDRLRRAAA